MTQPRIPVAVYRLQFHPGMRFEDARGLIPYFHGLGITDLYASPILQARRGSTHGYDVTDPSRLNPELGNEEEFENFVRQLQANGMGLLLDIVPNHMAASSENPWWMDLLEDGPGSASASHFDVDWHPPSRSLDNRILLPLLAHSYASSLENRQLALTFEEGSFYIRYFDTKLPVAAKSYRQILSHRLEKLKQTLGAGSPAFQEFEGILSALERLPDRSALLVEKAAERRLTRSAAKERLWRLCGTSAEVRRFINQNVQIFNGRKGVPSSFLHLDRLLSDQAYLLAFWRNTNEGINYRRFFTITDLVGIRVEDPVTFDATHAVILRLTEKSLITGLRVDHIDGLRDPLGYLKRLQDRLCPGRSEGQPVAFYVVVEKILTDGESLPRDWPVYGTTGYDFLNLVNGIFVDEQNVAELDRVYSKFAELNSEYEDLVYEKKKQVMESLLAVEMNSLGRHLSLLAEQDRYARELPRGDLARALVETIACLAVYRTYIRSFAVSSDDRRYIEAAITNAQARNPGLKPACFEFLRQVLLLRQGPQLFPEQRETRLAFVMRWQQFTGPIMAKGFEDSLLYVYNRLVSLNEVGGTPDSAGVPISAFHEFGLQRARRWPYTLNATSTHDSKRAEDVRARIDVLSEIPSEWEKHLVRWRRLNEKRKRIANGTHVPTPNEEILLYQTMIGAWPLRRDEVPNFRRRLQDYIIKATRDAMVHTKWTVPNVSHEKALVDFVEAITDESGNNEFLKDFLRFQRDVAYWGALNGLAQVLIKIGFPGVPELYQGSELWDLRLVDPDNRGPVDFSQRMRMAEELRKKRQCTFQCFRDLLEHWEDGRIKLYIVLKALSFRVANAELFLNGDYLPIEPSGNQKESVCAFARRWKRSWCLIAVPRLLTRLISPGQPPLGDNVWGKSTIALPKSSPKQWLNIFTREKITASPSGLSRVLHLRDIFQNFPVALLAAGSAHSI